ncbi:metal ABC transporter ATP-binding protein [Metasolibacillus meyeri]|uniref:metal ABC transporter ATP-binding protein n=1 Tax=Metasolibacillus meyeri TaxID=1071052 RepID=UPI000D302DD4|nr:metal ABC transporter ATP-binding protein [Metasolibacillus meyeri]
MQKTSRTTIRKINGDCLTPIVLFNRLQGTQKFLLESATKHETAGRYSFIGANPRKTYSGKGNALQEISDVTYSHHGDLIQSLKQMMPRISQHTKYPFMGGAIGYIRENEVLFQVYDTVIIFDHMTDELAIVHTNIEIEQQTPNLDELIEQLTNGTTNENHHAAFVDYRKFRIEQRAAYLYYVEFADHTLIGSSTHSVINVKDSVITTTLPTVREWTQDEQLPPSAHSIDALAEAAKSVPAMLGYIGFNGQIDFTAEG